MTPAEFRDQKCRPQEENRGVEIPLSNPDGVFRIGSNACTQPKWFFEEASRAFIGFLIHAIFVDGKKGFVGPALLEHRVKWD